MSISAVVLRPPMLSQMSPARPMSDEVYQEGGIEMQVQDYQTDSNLPPLSDY